MEINEGCFNNETKRQMGDEYRYRYPYDKFWEIVKEVGNTVVLGVDAHDPSAYNESARKMAMDFADELGLTVTEDLGITVKTPNPDAPIYSAPGVTEPTTGTGTAPTSVAEPSEVYADLLDFDMDSVEFREINGSTVTLEMVDDSLIGGQYRRRLAQRHHRIRRGHRGKCERYPDLRLGNQRRNGNQYSAELP